MLIEKVDKIKIKFLNDNEAQRYIKFLLLFLLCNTVFYVNKEVDKIFKRKIALSNGKKYMQ